MDDIHFAKRNQKWMLTPPFQAIANFIRDNEGEFLAAVSDTASRPAISNNASLGPNGEILLGAGAAILGGLIAAGGSVVIGGALAAGGAYLAIDGAIGHDTLTHLGSDIKNFVIDNRHQ